MVKLTNPRILVALTAIMAVIGLADAASAQDKLDRALREGQRTGKAQRVILKAKPGYDAWARQLLSQRNKIVDAELPSVGGFAVELSADELESFCNASVFDGCSEDSIVRPTAAAAKKKTTKTPPSRGATRKSNAAPAATAEYHSPAVSTVLGTLGLTADDFGGSGVTVALIDSGIHPSPAFSNRIKAFYDFTNDGIRRTVPHDDYGHGTHLAGLIGGRQNPQDAKYQGVAPGVEFVALKVLDESGAGFTSDVIRALEFAIEYRDFFGIDIINLSLGHPIFEPAATDPLVRAVEKASKAGIIVVVSAGNYGVDKDGEIGFAGTTSPGNAPSALTVGASDHKDTVTRDDDRVAVYSSNGPTWYDGLAKPDFVAPGHYLASEAAPNSTLFRTFTTLRTRGTRGKLFMHLSGTSMAAGVTTGVVALMKQAANQQQMYLTPNLAKGVLQFTAIPLKDDGGSPYHPLRQGTGGVNALGAGTLLSNLNTSVTHPNQEWLDMEPVTMIGSQSYAWAQNIIWGDNIVWGNTVYYNLPIWSLNIVWGNDIVWGDNIVWGDDLDNIVWGNNIVWGDNIVWGNNLLWDDNIVWGNNIVWGDSLLQPADATNAAFDDDNIVWGNLDLDNIVWGNYDLDNVVWGNYDSDNDSDNIVWGNFDSDNIVWGNVVLTGGR